jgi:hypothetical protein
MNKELSPEEISNNWETFKQLSKKTGNYENRQEAIKVMLDKYEDRIVCCPASNNLNYHCAYPGGLVEHTLNVLKFAVSIKNVIDSSVPQESLIMSVLFHDIGKIGNDEFDYYINQDSNWHREKGMVYKYNPKLPYMPVAQRSIFLLQFNEVKLSSDEFTSILIHDGQYINENKSWAMKEPTMALIVHQADVLANKKEKGEI